jgi:glutamyl/glutaminyl-tRNA synthetase
MEEDLSKIGDTLENRGKLLLTLCEEYIPAEWKKDAAFLYQALKTAQEKITQNPKEAKNYLNFFFEEPEVKKDLILSEKMKVDTETAKKVFAATRTKIETINDFSEESIKKTLTELVTQLGLKNGQVFWPLRAGLTGEQFTPGVFEVITALGKEKTMARLEKLTKEFS